MRPRRDLEPEPLDQRLLDINETEARIIEAIRAASTVVPLNSKRTTTILALDDLFERYMEDYAKPNLKTWRNMERAYRSYFGEFGKRNCLQITRSEVQQWYAALDSKIGSTTARRAVELLRTIYYCCYDWDLIPNYNPASRIKMKRLKPRERFLQPEELARFFAALKSLRYKTTQDLFMMCLLTGQRIGNVRLMRWDEISLDLALWMIPETKNGTSHKVPLIPEAVKLLSGRKRSSDWVFPSNFNKDKPICRTDKAWQRLVKMSGIKDLRLHDLRRTLASYEAITGANLPAIAQTLNHKDWTSTSIYTKLYLEPVREAIQNAVSKMFTHAGLPIEESHFNYEMPDIGPGVSETDKLVTTDEASKITGISVSTLGKMRYQNVGPPYIKKGFSVFYSLNMLICWMHGRTLSESEDDNHVGVHPLQ